jgi:hypothetical protein
VHVSSNNSTFVLFLIYNFIQQIHDNLKGSTAIRILA